MHAGQEACDDGNGNDQDACTRACLPARCGDGITRQDLSPKKPASKPVMMGIYWTRMRAPTPVLRRAVVTGSKPFGSAAMMAIWTVPMRVPINASQRCGDGIQRADRAAGEVGYEECDDGNAVENDGCLSNCLEARCGDGILVPGVEECDDGNEVETDLCTNLCRIARCGDGVVRDGLERCDDGNDDDTDGCRNTCQLAACGDGVRRLDLAPGTEGQEACDDGNAVESDGCRNDCAEARCGDGVRRLDLQQGDVGYEACDDGDLVATDACTDRCLEARCGDAIIWENNEECDDGNENAEDECTDVCGRPSAVMEWFEKISMKVRPVLKPAMTVTTTTPMTASPAVSFQSAVMVLFTSARKLAMMGN